MTINISIPDVGQNLHPQITVLGVGGSGGNAVNNMINSNLEGVDFVIANTDAQALQNSSCKKKIQLGVNSKFSHINLGGENSISHSFDFGFYKTLKRLDIGLVIQDFLNYSYWTTGNVEKGSASIILGSKILFKKISFNFDFNAMRSDYSLGIEYNYNSLFHIQLSHTILKKIYLAFLIDFQKFNIGYSFILPKYEQLGFTHTISLGINKNIFNYKD